MRNFISYKKSIEILNNIELNKRATQKVFITNAIGKVISKDINEIENNLLTPYSRGNCVFCNLSCKIFFRGIVLSLKTYRIPP